MKKRNISCFILLVSFMSVFISMPVVAEVGSFQIILHKRMYKEPEKIPEFKPNSGLEQLNESVETYGLNDVTFEIYNVTDWVMEERTTKSLEEIQKKIMDQQLEELRTRLQETKTLLTQVTTTTINGEDGVGIIQLDNSLSEASLLLIETSAPKINGEKIIRWAAPILISLPIEDSQSPGEYLKEIHIYPKNSGYSQPKIPKKEVPKVPKKVPPLKSWFPSTNEVKTMISLLGIVLLGSVVIVFQRRKNNR